MGILFAWIASITSGIEPLIIKASSKSLIKNPWLFNVLWTASGIPLIVVFALIKGGGLPQDWISILMLSFCSALFYIFYTLSLFKMDITALSPLFSLRTVFAVILGVVILHEKVNALGILLIAVIVFFSIFSAYDEKLKLRAFFQKYIFIALVCMLVLAFKGLFTNISVARNGYATTILWQDFLTLIILLPTLRFIKNSQEKLNLKKLFPFIFLGLADFIYSVTSTLAYGHNLALSSVIISLPFSIVFTYLLSKKYARFLETHSTRVYLVRFSATIIMIASAIWLSFL